MSLILTVFKELRDVETPCRCGFVWTGLPPVDRMMICGIGHPTLQGVHFRCFCDELHFIPVKSDLTEEYLKLRGLKVPA